MNNRFSRRERKNKKGVSIMIGYVLLISLAITMGIITYGWIKSYVPKDTPECPDGVSVLIKSLNCTIEGGDIKINMLLKNNGRFDLAGYYIYGANSSEQELATIDLSFYADSWIHEGARIYFAAGNQNTFKTNNEKLTTFIIPSSEINQINLIEVSPIRYQEQNSRIFSINCGGAKIKEAVTCQ
ncbi:MAG: hypothetical protein ABH804_00860 [archaeon]